MIALGTLDQLGAPTNARAIFNAVSSDSDPELVKNTCGAVELLRTQPFIRYDRSTAVGRNVQSIIKPESVEPLELLELNSISAFIRRIAIITPASPR